ncbi:MAG TPA: hypothetical protein VK511_09725 [Gemmatimonadaceae bacterium]|nr:hypothetical protein [Gemmatimonadaceae bacterium]
MRFSTILRTSGALSCALVSVAGAQRKSAAPSAETRTITAIVHRFYGDSVVPDRASILTTRYAAMLDTTPTPGAIIPRGTRLVIREIKRDSASAVYETESGPENRFADWYTYLVRDGGTWKIDNVRIYELPPPHYLILDSLAVKKNLPDTLLWMRDRMKLAASSNAALKAYFAAHKLAILKLASDFESHTTVNALDESGQSFPANSLPANDMQSLTGAMHALDLGAALRNLSALQCVRYKIGGAEQATVGYMHFRSTCPMPTMGTDDIIYMERVAPDWYLYRTG